MVAVAHRSICPQDHDISVAKSSSCCARTVRRWTPSAGFVRQHLQVAQPAHGSEHSAELYGVDEGVAIARARACSKNARCASNVVAHVQVRQFS